MVPSPAATDDLAKDIKIGIQEQVKVQQDSPNSGSSGNLDLDDDDDERQALPSMPDAA